MTTDRLLDSLLPAERRQHDAGADVEPATVTAGGMVASYRAKVRPAVETMERRGLLEWREARAARRLYRSYSLGIAGAREQGKGCAAWTPAGYTDLQLSAATEFRKSRVAVGAADWELIFAVCILDQPVRSYAENRLGSSSGRVIGLLMRRLRTALDRLATYHAEYDAESDRQR